LLVHEALSERIEHFTNTAYSVYFNVVRKQSKPELVRDVFKQDIPFLKLLRDKADLLTEHSFYFYWFPQVCECLQNISSLLFGITVDNVRNTLFTFPKFELLIDFVRQQGSRFLEKVRECCTKKKVC
jgi:hypothetical protein